MTDLERRPMKGKEKAWDVEVDERESGGRWWKVWDVRTDCREIGGMECYGTPPPPLLLFEAHGQMDII